MPTLKQLTNFITLAEELHFAQAAQKLGISQAALSNDLKKLEHSVGCQLVDRSDRWQIKLTEAGEIYFRQIKNIPGEMQSAHQSALKAARGETGTLSIVVAAIIYDYFNLGKVCKAMLDKYPEIKLRIYEQLVSPQAVRMLTSGACDVGIFATSQTTLQEDGIRYHRIDAIPRALAIPRNHPLASQNEITISALANCNFIMPPVQEAPYFRQQIEHLFFKNCHRKPTIAHEAMGRQATLQLVAAGLGIGIMPAPRYPEKYPEVVIRPFPSPVERYIVAAWDESNQSQVLRNFISMISPV